MVVRNNKVYLNNTEVKALCDSKKEPSINLEFLHKKNKIEILGRSGAVLEKVNSEFFICDNLWGLPDETVWKIKPFMDDNGDVRFSLFSMMFKFRVNRTETIKITGNKRYSGILFKSGRLYLNPLAVDLDPDKKYKINMIKMYAESNMLTVTTLGNLSYREIILNRNYEFDSNIVSLSSFNDGEYYRTPLLRNAQRFYGTLSNYTYLNQEEKNNTKVFIFKKESVSNENN